MGLLRGAVLALLADAAIRRGEGSGEGAGAVAQMAGEDFRKTRPSPLHAGSRNPGSTKGKGAQDMAHREQKRNRKEEVLGAGGADA